MRSSALPRVSFRVTFARARALLVIQQLPNRVVYTTADRGTHRGVTHRDAQPACYIHGEKKEANHAPRVTLSRLHTYLPPPTSHQETK